MDSPPPVQRLGNVLFKFRSFTPVPIIALLAYLLFKSRGAPGPGGYTVDAVLNLVGILVALSGQALRFRTLGLVPEGTSGQGNALEAATLNRQGPYAYVRNPLYVGNLGIVQGLLLIAHEPLVYAIGLLFFFGEYFFIIRAEEAFLRNKFGPAFDEFCARVPRWIPRPSRAFEGQLRQTFDIKRALKKEHNPFAAWAIGACLLLYWEFDARGELSSIGRWAITGYIAVVVIFFALVKGYKRGVLFKEKKVSP